VRRLGGRFLGWNLLNRLSDSGGPGFVFLTITDTSQLSGKIIFVLRAVGITSSNFALTIE
jgi:hypothetical protein